MLPLHRLRKIKQQHANNQITAEFDASSVEIVVVIAYWIPIVEIVVDIVRLCLRQSKLSILDRLCSY